MTKYCILKSHVIVCSGETGYMGSDRRALIQRAEKAWKSVFGHLNEG